MIVCFAEAKRRFATPFNALVAFLTGGKFCHVAIIFEMNENTDVFREVSIVKTGNPDNDVVQITDVEDLTGWTCYRIILDDPNKETEAYDHVVRNMLGRKYDKTGSVADFALCCCFPQGYRSLYHSEDTDTKTYCSRLAMSILQYCGLFVDFNPEKVAPNTIYKMIKDDSYQKNARWQDVTTTIDHILHRNGENSDNENDKRQLLFF
jgi:hypothetical protein